MIGNFNGYFAFENKMILDIISGYIILFTFSLKLFYSRYRLDDQVFRWIEIFKIFHRNVESKEIKINEQMTSKLWRSTLKFNNLTKLMIHLEILLTISVYIWVYSNLPDYFKFSYLGFLILIVEFILIINIYRTFESFYFLFCIVCNYLRIRTDYVLNRMNSYVNKFERKLNDRFINDEKNILSNQPFSNEINQDQEFDPFLIFKLLREHNSICVLIRKYNYFWRFYLFIIFFTMPIIIGYFIFLLTFENMFYVHRISLAFIIVLLISYFYLVTAPAVYLSGRVGGFLIFKRLKVLYHIMI